MAEETTMVLKVDLGCHRCYRKIKKLLCKYPEIRDQVFFEKEDTVKIKVVCCSPERIRQKLICKGGKTIKSIEIIKVLEKTKPPPEKPKPPPEKPKEAEKPKPPPEKPSPKSKPPKERVVEIHDPKKAEKPIPPPEKPKEAEKPKPADPPKEKPVEKPLPQAPVPGYPQLQLFPVAVCCKPCYDLGHGGPCHHGYGTPYQPPSSNDGYVRLVPSYDEPSGSWSSWCRCNRSYGCRCESFTEENPACTIM